MPKRKLNLISFIWIEKVCLWVMQIIISIIMHVVFALITFKFQYIPTNEVSGLASDKGPLSQSHAVWLCLVPSEFEFLLVQYCNVVSPGTLVRLSLEHGWTHLMKYLHLLFLMSYLGSSALIFQRVPARPSPPLFDDSKVTRSRDDLNSTYIFS